MLQLLHRHIAARAADARSCVQVQPELANTGMSGPLLSTRLRARTRRRSTMKVSFPAMKGHIGQRPYYSCLMKLNAIPKMFTFRDWKEFSAEDREQRVLNKKRVPEIAKYMLDNEDGYLFASITASYRCPVKFTSVNGDDNAEIGKL